MISSKDIYSHKNNLQIITEYLFALFTILQCNSIFLFQVGKNKDIIKYFWQILLFILAIYACNHLKNITSKFIDFLCLFSFIISLFLIFELFYYPQFPKHYIISLLFDPVIFIIYLFSYKENVFNYNSVFYKIENIMIILAVISIPFWIMSIIGVSPNTSILTTGWYNSNFSTIIPSYFDIGFHVPNTAHWFGMNFIRNSGIFAEPSMFSYPLNVALFIELFLKRHKRILNIRVIILVLVGVTTASTTGIVFSLLSVFFAEIFKNRKNIKYVYLLLIPLLFVILRTVINNKVNSRQTQSYTIRSEDIKFGLKAWYNHLFVGNGLGNVNSITSFFGEERFLSGNAGVSAGFTTVLACGGIILGLFYILPIVCSFTLSRSLSFFAFFSLVPLIFVSVQDTYLCIIIIAYLWTSFIIGNMRYKDWNEYY